MHVFTKWCLFKTIQPFYDVKKKGQMKGNLLAELMYEEKKECRCSTEKLYCVDDVTKV